MNTFYSWIIITFASILASFLVFIGIKKLPFNVKSKSVFGVMLSFFLFSGCSNIDKKQQELKVDTSTTLSDLNKKPKIINIEKEFKSKERWLKIKKIWKFLNKVEPKDNGIYLNTLKKEEQIKVNKDLLDAFGYNFYKINQIKDVSDLERILYALINDRIGELTFPRELMVRMMAPPSSGLRRTTIIEMEKEIDVLIKLRKNKKVSSKEVSELITKIQDKVYMSCFLSIFKTSLIAYNLRLNKFKKIEKIDETIDLWIKEYNDLHTKTIKKLDVNNVYIKDYKTKNIKVQKELENMKKLKSKIYSLIQVLEAE